MHTLILEHSYWLKFWSNLSECLKISVVKFLAENIFIGSGPGLPIAQDTMITTIS